MPALTLFASDVAAAAGLNRYKTADEILAKIGAVGFAAPPTVYSTMSAAAVRALCAEAGVSPQAPDAAKKAVHKLAAPAVRANSLGDALKLERAVAEQVVLAVRAAGGETGATETEIADEVRGVVNRGRGTRLERRNTDLYEKTSGQAVRRRNACVHTLVLKMGNSLPDVRVRGKVDGVQTDPVTGAKTLVETKTRRNRLFNQIPVYEKVQMEVYMRMIGAHVGVLNQNHAGKTSVLRHGRSDDLWAQVMDGLRDFARRAVSASDSAPPSASPTPARPARPAMPAAPAKANPSKKPRSAATSLFARFRRGNMACGTKAAADTARGTEAASECGTRAASNIFAGIRSAEQRQSQKQARDDRGDRVDPLLVRAPISAEEQARFMAMEQHFSDGTTNQAWLDSRGGVITGSRVAALVKGHGYDSERSLLRKMLWPSSSTVNRVYCDYGLDNEDRCEEALVSYLEARVANESDPLAAFEIRHCGQVRDCRDRSRGYSPDGYVIETYTDGRTAVVLAEYKCPYSKRLLAGGGPAPHGGKPVAAAAPPAGADAGPRVWAIADTAKAPGSDSRWLYGPTRCPPAPIGPENQYHAPITPYYYDQVQWGMEIMSRGADVLKTDAVHAPQLFCYFAVWTPTEAQVCIIPQNAAYAAELVRLASSFIDNLYLPALRLRVAGRLEYGATEETLEL